MTTPVRLRLSRRKGFDLQAHSRAANELPAVKCARPSAWANPFRIGDPSGCEFEDGGDPTPMIAALTREQVISFFDDAVRGHLSPEMHPHGHRWQREFLRRFRGMHPADAVRSYLRGNNLACWCRLCPAHAATGKPFDVACPDCAPCHTDPLGRRANRMVCDAVEGADRHPDRPNGSHEMMADINRARTESRRDRA